MSVVKSSRHTIGLKRSAGIWAAVEDRFNNPFVDRELMSIYFKFNFEMREKSLPSLRNTLRRKKDFRYVCQ